MFSNCLLSNDILSCVCKLYLGKRNVALEQESKLSYVICYAEWNHNFFKRKELFLFYLENKNAVWIFGSLMISLRERLDHILHLCSS